MLPVTVIAAPDTGSGRLPPRSDLQRRTQDVSETFAVRRPWCQDAVSMTRSWAVQLTRTHPACRAGAAAGVGADTGAAAPGQRLRRRRGRGGADAAAAARAGGLPAGPRCDTDSSPMP